MDNRLSEILSSIDELASRGKITRNRAFAAWFAMTFFNVDEDDALEAAASDGGNDQGIDIIFADDSTQEIVILQAHCPENFDKTTPKNKWDAVISSIPYLNNPEHFVKTGRPDIAESITALKKSYPEYTTALGLITLGQKSDSIEQSVQAHQADSSNKRISYFHFAQQDIIVKYKSLVEAEAGIPEDSIKFIGSYFEDSGDYGRAWVGSVSAGELKRLFETHNVRLFAGNVRLFLGARKGGINEQIIKTAQEHPGNFWALNNGITIVADHASISKGDENSSALTLKRFSIVNGCQTTSSLVKADASPETKVLARVIAAKMGLKNEIVRYNNSQNAVKIWTVRAVDNIQEELRKEFAKSDIIYAPKQEGSRKKKSLSTIELDKVTQYLASSEQRFLTQAIDNKSQLFDEPYQKIYRKGIKVNNVYLAWLVGNIADQERQRMADALSSDPNAGLLSVTSGYWIIYCTYKLFSKFTDLNSPHINLKKMQTDDFSNALRKYVAKSALMFYDVAVDTYDREDYGSFKSTLRSAKFLQKIDSKLNGRLVALDKKTLPDLIAVCKSAK